MRVLFVSSGLDTGGAEYALLRLLPTMRDHGIDARVVSLRDEGTIGPMLRAVAIPVVPLGLPAPVALLRSLPNLIRCLHDHGSKLVHGWMYHGNLAAMLAGARGEVPVVWGIRQSLGPGNRDKWMTKRLIQAGALLSSRAAAIVYNSAAARQQHEGCGYASACGAVVPNGFDTGVLKPDDVVARAIRDELRIERDVPLIGHVARFQPAKDHVSFLRAAARVKGTYPGATFVLAGAGVENTNVELVSLIGSLRLADSVRLLGRRDDVARLMAGFDVLCLTSAAEAFPNVIGEAMSCGVPCVGTAVGDVAELIGDTGEVVPPGDPEAVAAAVGRLLALEPAARRALGERARQRIINRYSIGEVARRYAELLRSVVERHG